MDKEKLVPYERNQGKKCSTPGCIHKARVKGYCINCYTGRYTKKRKELLLR